MAAPAAPIALTIERMSTLGEGVAQLEGRTVFVDGAFTGERVRAVVREDGRVLRGELLEVLSASPARRAPACDLAGLCGGCDWLHVAEPAQREAKQELVLSALEHLGGLSRAAFELLPTLPSPQPFGYRRRAVFHWAQGGWSFYGRRTHHPVQISRCPALLPGLQALPAALTGALEPIAKDVEELDLLAEGGKAAIALVLKGPVKARTQEVAQRALKAASLAGAVLVPHEGSPVLVGKPVLRAQYPLRPEVPLFLRPDAFSQANAEGNLGLVTSAIQRLAPREQDSVLELFCGNGNFSFALAGAAASVLGVESSSVSLQLALRSAQEGKVENVRFVEGDAERVCRGLISERRSFDLLLADPPRAGAPGLAGWAKALGVKRVVYVACDVASLARDGRALKDAGFVPKALQLVEMFPQTHHVEAVASFERAGHWG